MRRGVVTAAAAGRNEVAGPGWAEGPAPWALTRIGHRQRPELERFLARVRGFSAGWRALAGIGRERRGPPGPLRRASQAVDPATDTRSRRSSGAHRNADSG